MYDAKRVPRTPKFGLGSRHKLPLLCAVRRLRYSSSRSTRSVDSGKSRGYAPCAWYINSSRCCRAISGGGGGGVFFWVPCEHGEGGEQGRVYNQLHSTSLRVEISPPLVRSILLPGVVARGDASGRSVTRRSKSVWRGGRRGRGSGIPRSDDDKTRKQHNNRARDDDEERDTKGTAVPLATFFLMFLGNVSLFPSCVCVCVSVCLCMCVSSSLQVRTVFRLALWLVKLPLRVLFLPVQLVWWMLTRVYRLIFGGGGAGGASPKATAKTGTKRGRKGTPPNTRK